MDLINEIELNLPVADWTVDEVEVWPLIRHRLGIAAMDQERHVSQQLVEPPLKKILRKGRGAVSAQVSNTKVNLIDRAHSADVAPVDFVFVGSGSDRVELNGEWFERFVEPLTEPATELGFTSLHLEPGKNIHTPRHNKSVPIQGKLDRSMIKSFSRKDTSGDELRQFPELLSYLKKHELDRYLSIKYINRRARVLELMTQYFSELLGKTQPRAGFVVNYGTISMAFNRACALRGIPSIEIQHGLIDPLHYGYGRWVSVPKNGFTVMPTLYWTWDAASAEAISAWSTGVEGRHAPFVGGNAFLQMWLDGSSRLVKEHDQMLDAIAPKSSDSIDILDTFSIHHVDDRELSLMRNTITRAPKTWRWWFRNHPRMTSSEAERVGRLAESLRRQDHFVETDKANSMSLYALLRHMDVHVTRASSSVIEAKQFGVASVVTDSQNLTRFTHETNEGWAVSAETPDQLAAQISKQRVAASSLTPPPQNPATKETLEELIRQLQIKQ